MRTRHYGWIALAGFLALILFSPSGDTQSAAKSPVLGQEAPLFTATTLEGKKLDLQKLRGKLVLIDFWATWCPPCRAEVPHLLEVYEKYHKKGFEIVSVSVNDKEAKVKEFQKTHKMNWIHIRDAESKIAEKYGVVSIPAPFLIDPEGKLIAKDADLRGPGLMNQVAEHIKSVPEIKEPETPASETE
ncbi:MAG TPA: TlpA disulfide reductase family protein [bacterium]|nr:TlpA disulfide reductase family protein [bacterium]